MEKKIDVILPCGAITDALRDENVVFETVNYVGNAISNKRHNVDFETFNVEFLYLILLVI